MFDGPDGVGKTTQLHRLSDELTGRGFRVYTTRMNGGTEIGEALRQVILTEYERPAATDFYILQAITAALIADLATRRNDYNVILIDRSPLSILAYQVYAEGFSADLAYPAVESALQAIAPNALLCLHASIDTITRHKGHRDNSDHFEQQPQEFHQKVIDGYVTAAERIQVTQIDAEGTIEQVYDRIKSVIEPMLPSLAA